MARVVAAQNAVNFAKIGQVKLVPVSLRPFSIANLNSKVSQQKQREHLEGPNYEGGSYMASYSDAQAVLNAVKNGTATILGRTPGGQRNVVVSVPGIVGTYVDNGIHVPTSNFIIKGITTITIVPHRPWVEMP